MNSIIYLGMDVHKETYNLCAYNNETGEICGETKCKADIKLVIKFIENLKKTYGEDLVVKAGYEAGCLGYVPYHQLTKYGIDCDILAPTTMARSSKEKLNKNDKLDARNIATNLANGTYKSVYVPNDEDLAVKEYIRMLDDTKIARKKVKQHINAFVLRQGYKYEGKSKWTIAHLEWLKTLPIIGLLRETLDEYLSQYDDLCNRIDRYGDKLIELSHEESYEQSISHLRCFKGIDTTAAMTVHVEISDFTRFLNACAFASYLGLTPGESSSGSKTTYLSITKQGNTTVRNALVESAQALVKGRPGIKSKAVKARQKGQDIKVIDYADKAVDRLQRKYRKLINRGVHHNKAVVAVARELACFIWGMETGRILSLIHI